MDTANRTFVCSVLFLDIVEYSRRSIAEQMLLKQRFNVLLGKTLGHIAADDRIVLDTGDGAAVSFLGNPEDTLFVSTSLRDAIARDDPGDPARLSLRFGINLGPVRLIEDFNSQVSIIGDGINGAQRVMSFATAGQILVSRSYYEIVSRLDPQFSQLFRYEGARTDKHVRKHEVYALDRSPPGRVPLVGAQSTRPMPERPACLPAAFPGPLGRAQRRRLFVALPVTMAVILSAGVGARMQREDAAPAVAQSVPHETAPMNASARVLPAAAPASVSALAPYARAPVAARQAAVGSPGGEPQKPAPRKQGSGDPAAARFLVVPWGEIIIDGKSRGVTPPMRQLQLASGRHRIEIRNTSFPAYTRIVTVRAGEKLTIRHRFK